MTRDYSQFFPPSTAAPRAPSALKSLGWQAFFAQQTDVDTLAATPPVRVMTVHRSGLVAQGDGPPVTLPPDVDVTVGDWLLYDSDHPADSVLLDRKSLIKRRAPGHDRRVQLIAANIDTAFIVTSCNQDFNIARLERYVALAFEAEVTPVIVLTKADLCDDPDDYAAKARAISDLVQVVTVDARSEAPKTALAPWCGLGQTVAFIGSSGVGKSTLTNALLGDAAIDTAEIREDDAKGRHTTTRRQIHLVAGGCAILDTPGMRELQLTDASSGVDDLFADLLELAHQCKFRDCKHESEPGCAILAGVAQGAVDPARVQRWQKLVDEDVANSLTMAQRKAKGKALGKTIRQFQKDNKKKP